jgi:hypothetical protein
MQGETSRKPIPIPAIDFQDSSWSAHGAARASRCRRVAECRSGALQHIGAGDWQATHAPSKGPVQLALSVRDPATTLARFRSNETSPRMQQVCRTSHRGVTSASVTRPLGGRATMAGQLVAGGQGGVSGHSG